MKDAAELAKNAQILMNVSEFTDISTVTDTLISAIQAFSYTADESMHVVDIMNTIGEQYCRFKSSSKRGTPGDWQSRG